MSGMTSLLVLALWLPVYALALEQSETLPEVEYEESVTIQPEDQACEADKDCTVVYPSCISGCDKPCGTPVHKSYERKCHLLIDECRSNRKLEWCEQAADCAPLQCINKRCIRTD